MSSDRLHQTCKLLILFLVVFASAVLNILSKDRSSVRPAIDSRITFCQGPLIIAMGTFILNSGLLIWLVLVDFEILRGLAGAWQKEMNFASSFFLIGP